MDEIPIKFELHGKPYEGQFYKFILPGNVTSWALRINSIFRGSLQYDKDIGWIFFEEQYYFGELKDFFVEYLIAWYDGAD